MPEPVAAENKKTSTENLLRFVFFRLLLIPYWGHSQRVGVLLLTVLFHLATWFPNQVFH
jgi:hypothetical protein